MYIVTTEEMRQLEQAAVDAGATWAHLMERAGTGVAHTIIAHVGREHIRNAPVLVLVGGGNNGGDALVVARHLHEAGAVVTLYIWNRHYQPNDTNWVLCRERAITHIDASTDTDYATLKTQLHQAAVVVDGLLGMGCNRPVAGTLAHIVTTVNDASKHAAAPYIVAIDVPTGIHSDTGAIMGVALHAHMTIATGLVKYGLLVSPGCLFAGSLHVVDLGIPPTHLESIMSQTLEQEQARLLLPTRPIDAHKGTFGHALIVAGSLNYPGAASLASAGAARAGAGLVTLATARSISMSSTRLPDIIVMPLPEADFGTLGKKSAHELLKRLAETTYQALLVGCGVGQDDATLIFLKQLLGMEHTNTRTSVGFYVEESSSSSTSASSTHTTERTPVGFRIASASDNATAESTTDSETDKHPNAPSVAYTLLPPLVIDADGLNLLSKIDNWHTFLPTERCILTPHPGEMKRLLATDTLGTDETSLVTTVANAAQTWRQVVVLKGATTVIAAPTGHTRVYVGNNPALATGGTGDVLAGIITGLVAQGVALFDAAALGVYLHGRAGAMVRDAMGTMGTVASDVPPYIPLAIRELAAS